MSENRPAEPKRAFISHSSPDDRYVQEMVQYLRKLGYSEVFNDSHTIEPDEEFWPRIEKGIHDCDAFVVVLSHASVQSHWVDREVQFARSNGKSVIPIRIDDCKLPATFDGRDVIELCHGRGDRVKIAPSRILRHAPAILFGRERWLEILDAAWNKQNINLYTLVSWGGMGKTSLVAHWVADRFMRLGWPSVERYFDWSFYSQGTGESRQTSADLFINVALKFFDDPEPTAGDAWERGERLARLIRQHRTLLVLDGIEPLQIPPNDKSRQAGRLKDPGLEALVQCLAADNPGLCVITTRMHLTNVEALPTAEETKLDRLPRDAAFALLRQLQIIGTNEELEAAWKDASGHALTLQLLGRFICDAYPDHDIRHYKQVKLIEAEEERSEGRSAFKVMLAYEKWLSSAGPERQRELAILRLTGLFDRPILGDCIHALRAEPAIAGLTDILANLKETQWNIALQRLIDIDLLSRSGHGNDVVIDAHPLVREYFADQLRRQWPDAFREAQSRLFWHLFKTTRHRPDDLAGLQPLYQAVVHGCLAGLQNEAVRKVYIDRILRGVDDDGYYSRRKLGAVGLDLAAVAAFFDELWTKPSPNLGKGVNSWLFSEAAFLLQALGRCTEAVEPMRESIKQPADARHWSEASRRAGNLSQMLVTIGRLQEAINVARGSVDLADRTEDPLDKVHSRTTAANALHQVGQRAESQSLFAEAERLQATEWPGSPILWSTHGTEYIDLILSPAELAAWHATLYRCAVPFAKTRIQEHDSRHAAIACAEAERRVLAIRTQLEGQSAYTLLYNALDHLSLARARLYQKLISPSPSSEIADLYTEIHDTIAMVRQANHLQFLPLPLLTAALHTGTVSQQRDQARRLLGEAQQIAERGPMPLYLADVHLHRARLFRDKAELAKARALIEKHGYWRRKEELEDAEAALA
jgi:hypothetical protein